MYFRYQYSSQNIDLGKHPPFLSRLSSCSQSLGSVGITRLTVILSGKLLQVSLRASALTLSISMVHARCGRRHMEYNSLRLYMVLTAFHSELDALA